MLSLPLQRDYCPPIDSSLFHALVSDFDITLEESAAELRATLEALKEAAVSEETANFDPSGTNSVQEEACSQDSSEKARSWHGDVLSISAMTDETDFTVISQQLNDVHFQDNGCNGIEQGDSGKDWEDIPMDRKEEILQDMFPNAKAVDVAYVLKKAGDNYGRAVEELLNQAFLEAEVDERGMPIIRRGVEGFSEPTTSRKGRKRKGKKSQLHRRTSSTPGPLMDRTTNGSPSPSSRWDCAKEDIDFIATRTHISPPIIASLYHKNGASLPATVSSICRSNDFDNPYLSNVEPSVLEVQAAELGDDFPDLQPPQTNALVQLAYPSTASAHELARSLMCSPHPLAHEKIIPVYSPRPPSPDSQSKLSPPSALRFPSQTAATLATTRSTAYSQASSAYRLSKSRPLMGGAAAYYSSVARDASMALRERESTEADLLVTARSRPGEVDFHGVNVRDAVTIAKQRAETWWEHEGREWAREGKVQNGGLRMITGKGQHSEGGKGKLGPAIGASLVKSGWKVEVGHGFIDVVGRVRR